MQPSAQLLVQHPESVGDVSLGLARHLAANALAVCPIPEADHAAPAARAALVKARVLTRRALMIEIDGAIAMASPPGSHTREPNPFGSRFGSR